MTSFLANETALNRFPTCCAATWKVEGTCRVLPSFTGFLAGRTVAGRWKPTVTRIGRDESRRTRAAFASSHEPSVPSFYRVGHRVSSLRSPKTAEAGKMFIHRSNENCWIDFPWLFHSPTPKKIPLIDTKSNAIESICW